MIAQHLVAVSVTARVNAQSKWKVESRLTIVKSGVRLSLL